MRRISLAFVALATACLDVLPEPIIQTGEAPQVLVGAGDIADCGSQGDEATAVLLDTIPGTVFTAGDNAYDNGTAVEFANCYDPAWGRHRNRTRPSPGNHDYHTADAAGYFAYFGERAGDPTRGYYAYEIGGWRIYSLNSNVQRDAGSPQEQWLREELAATPRTCTLAYWHHPRFSSSSRGNDPSMSALYAALVDAGTDLVIAGHDHVYERFALQDTDGVASADGIRQFVAGTGGRALYDFGAAAANSEVRYNDDWGVLKLTLLTQSYEWEFISATGGQVIDSGSQDCHS